jgi:hypothetical protein
MTRTKKLGGPGQFFCADSKDIYGISPGSQQMWWYNHKTKQWGKFGGAAKQLLRAAGRAFIVAPDGKSVFEWAGQGEQWSKIGDRYHQLIGGGSHLYGIEVGSNDLHMYHEGQKRWEKVGGPGLKFVATGDILIGMSPNRASCWARINGNWQQVSGFFEDLIAGNGMVFGIHPQTHDIYKWNYPQPNNWTKIGGPGKLFAVCHDGLFGISPGGTQVWHWDGVPDKWHQCQGVAAADLVPHGKKMLYIDANTKDILKISEGEKKH